MKITDLINEKYEYRWDVIQSIPEFAVLESCEQNPRWHSEGNAWEHTKMVCIEARNLVVSGKIFPVDERFEEIGFYKVLNTIFLAAALFHDIGKSVTTKLGKDDNWHSYGHEVEGEKITRYLLWDENPLIREKVCALVRWHMEPLHIFDHKEWLKEIIDISHECMWKMLIGVEECDVKGSIKSAEEEERSLDTNILKSLEVFVKQYLKCWEEPCEIPIDKRKIECVKAKMRRDYGDKVWVNILIGLSGAGKSTYAEKKMTDDSIIISRDIIRAELGFCKEGEKVVLSPNQEKIVSEIFEKKMVEAAKERKIIFIDNLNLKKKYRDEYKRILKNFNVYWNYIYVEAPSLADNVSRRAGMVDEKVFKDMIFKFEFPKYEEFDELTIIKDGKEINRI